MTTLDVVDIAVMVARHSRGSHDDQRPLPRRPLTLTLRAVDQLDGLWKRALARPSAAIGDPHPYASREALLEEMLVSELLLRTWTAHVLTSRCEATPTPSPRRIGYSLTTAVLHHRRRILLTLLHDDLPANLQLKLDRTRRLMERWTDVLLGAWPESTAISLLRFDDERSREFATLWSLQSGDRCGTEPVLLTSLRAAAPDVLIACPERAEAFRQLFSALMACRDWRPARVGGDGAAATSPPRVRRLESLPDAALSRIYGERPRSN
ncbi:MAG: hypothetical protein KF774_12355 [Planctomyces sp.]|nr:hypothetical protein [Planctomyces sp.]